jgi:N-acyl-D-aspartate/D-glutamate deacylase
MHEAACGPQAGVLARHAAFDRLVIGDTFSDANRGLSGRLVGDVAAERGQCPFDTLVDIVLEDDLRTVLWPLRPQTDDLWALRGALWDEPWTVLGGSDAGAHLDRTCGSIYTTSFLDRVLHGSPLVSLERAVAMLTTEPARVFGLRRRGRIASGCAADLVLFDPDVVGAGDVGVLTDLPGGATRLSAPARGISRVMVNGVDLCVEGTLTGATPGTLLRSGRDTSWGSAA